MSIDKIPLLFINVLLAIIFFYSAYDVAINNNFFYYIDSRKIPKLKENKKVLGEKLGLVSLILGFSFFISPIYILRDDYTLGIYIVLLFLISIGAIISIKSILKKHLYEE